MCFEKILYKGHACEASEDEIFVQFVILSVIVELPTLNLLANSGLNYNLLTL